MEVYIRNKEQIIEAIESMTVLELSELVKALEEKLGIPFKETYTREELTNYLKGVKL